jgi:hypothetical protein
MSMVGRTRVFEVDSSSFFYLVLAPVTLRTLRGMSEPREELTSAAQAVSPELVSSSNSDVEPS